MRTIVYDLPIGCRGYICRDPATDEDVAVLNARYTRECNLETFLHEQEHAANRDLDSAKPVSHLENERHGRNKIRVS